MHTSRHEIELIVALLNNFVVYIINIHDQKAVTSGNREL